MLTGSMTGSSRAEIQTKSRALATAYFGTECVAVDLRDESAEEMVTSHSGEIRRTTFSANFDAQEHHDLESQSYGPDQCRGCEKQSWPHSRLPQRTTPHPKGTPDE